jgi:hypothetical protein
VEGAGLFGEIAIGVAAAPGFGDQFDVGLRILLLQAGYELRLPAVLVLLRKEAAVGYAVAPGEDLEMAAVAELLHRLGKEFSGDALRGGRQFVWIGRFGDREEVGVGKFRQTRGDEDIRDGDFPLLELRRARHRNVGRPLLEEQLSAVGGDHDSVDALRAVFVAYEDGLLLAYGSAGQTAYGSPIQLGFVVLALHVGVGGFRGVDDLQGLRDERVFYAALLRPELRQLVALVELPAFRIVEGELVELFAIHLEKGGGFYFKGAFELPSVIVLGRDVDGPVAVQRKFRSGVFGGRQSPRGA